MPNIIACRLASYGDYQDRAWTHLPEIGIRNVELPVPAPADVAATLRRLGDHGLTATSVQGRCDISQPDAAATMQAQLEACAALDARFCFVSIKAGDTPRPQVWQRMREVGDRAAALNVTVVMETHPDLVTNGDIARETMQAIDHPHVRINFDTGNIHFYNRDRTAAGELTKIIDYVAAVHIKDSSGNYQEWNFPSLGTGVVDFPEVFRMLNARGFTGPFAMELEGTKGVERTEDEQLEYIAASVRYLREIGVLT
jgi:sugar phosphate isomerase/epimerase